jgi:hypothetical protein
MRITLALYEGCPQGNCLPRAFVHNLGGFPNLGTRVAGLGDVSEQRGVND